jgi:hypothetical protein
MRCMKRLYPALLLLLFTLSACDQSDDSENRYKRDAYKEERKQTFRFIPVSYGIGESKVSETVDDSESVTGHHNYISDFRVDTRTDTIPAQLGTEFGIRFTLKSNMDRFITLRKVWTFPHPINNGHKQFSTIQSDLEITPNDPMFSSYLFEKDYELVKGKWTLCFYYQDQLLYRKVFVVI